MRCVAVVGPSHTGKTTLVDKLAGLEEKAERVATGSGPELVSFSFLGDAWTAIDCPGAIEAICQTQNALLAADAAILCVSPNPDEAVLAAPYLRAVERAGTPTLIFIGHIDQPRGRIRDVVAALQDYAEHPIVLRQIPIRNGEEIVGVTDLISERAWRYRAGQQSDLIEIPEDLLSREKEARTELLEQFSDFDDWLLEELIEDRRPASGPLYSISSRMTSGNKLISAFIGSAAKGNGIVRLMKALRHEAPGVEVLKERLAAAAAGELDEPPIAVTLAAHHRQHAGKTVVVRSLDDGVRQAQAAGGGNVGSIADALGGRGTAGALAAGCVGLAVKSDHLGPGEVLSRNKRVRPETMIEPIDPMLARVLMANSDRDDAKLSPALGKLAGDDPGIRVSQEDSTGRPVVHVQGPLSLRALKETLQDVFGVSVEDHDTETMFRESITKRVDEHYRHRKQTGGSGQFADVKLVVEPNGRDQGFAFEDTIKGGAVPSNYIPAVEAGARDAMDRGPLGFPVIDIRVTLVDGQYHSVDSSDFAFRTAGRMGVREALGKAGPVLLQPIHKVELHVPSVFSGALVPLISSLHGQVLGFDRDPAAKGWDIFRALLPAPALGGLVNSLRAATQGVGYFTSEFDHYEELYGREAERIQQAQGEAHAAQ